MAGTLNPAVGTDMRIAMSGVSVSLNKLNITPDATKLPSTNFNSQGAREYVFGTHGCAITLEGLYDVENDPHAIFGLVPGGYIDDVLIYISVARNEFYNFTQICVESIKIDGEVDGTGKLSVTAFANGPWTYPLNAEPQPNSTF